ncbi:MAG: carbohydrate kinase family protein [Cyclobacteriaceae bacterium]|nr:carbohydrate kinase family protein [Cyclobacteriaceae bacterium]
MKKLYDVVVIGELNVDLILNQVDKFPSIGKEVLASHMTLTLGSSSAIFASNLSTLGSKVTFVGNLGHDNFGDHIIASLKSRGVDTENINRSVKQNTGATIVLNFDEDRAMVTYPGAMKYLSIQDVSDEVLKHSRHLHLSSIFLQTGIIQDVVQLYKKAKEVGLTTSLDPQWDPAEKWNLNLKELLPYVDIFMPNLTELTSLTNAVDLKSAIDKLKSFANKIVVKNGSNGAYLWENNELIHQTSFLNKEVVDSIGAGDSFDSGFIHQFLNGKSNKECLEFGALTGAINTTRSGGTNAFENLSLVKMIAKSSFNYTF